jgi:5'-nucleotidase
MSQGQRRFARILLTNDDGCDAPGLAALTEAAEALADEVWVVAPEHDQSGQSRAVSLHNPLRLYPRGERRYAVSGTPSDCVLLALRHLMLESPPDLVLSGINRGANIGQEVAYSGTVSAALAARLCGVPAIAFSQAFRDRTLVRWDTARALVDRTFDFLQTVGGLSAAPDAVLNVNFPDVAVDSVSGFEFTRQAVSAMMQARIEQRADSRGIDYFWLGFGRDPGAQADDSDIAALRRRAVSITPVGFDATDHAALAALRSRV